MDRRDFLKTTGSLVSATAFRGAEAETTPHTDTGAAAAVTSPAGTFDATVELPVGPNVSESGKFHSKYRLQWAVPFQPGALTATGYSHGQVVARDEVHTASAPARIRLVADRSVITADGDDLSFVTVRIEDREGHLCPVADNLVSFQVSGAGKIEAVDNGNAATVEPFHANYRKAFNGLALLIVRSDARQAGQIQVVATGAGLAQGQLALETRKVLPAAVAP